MHIMGKEIELEKKRFWQHFVHDLALHIMNDSKNIEGNPSKNINMEIVG